MKATAILVSYKRQPNISEIIPALRKQTADLYIVLANNGQPYTAGNPEAEPDEIWIIPHNIGPFVRFLVAYAYEGWLYFQDDDLVPADDKFVEDLITVAMKRPESITSPYGRHITNTSPHYAKHSELKKSGFTNFVKTVCMTMHRDLLRKVRFPVNAKQLWRNDDIHVALETSGGKPIHYVDRSFAARLKQLPQFGVGLYQQKQHYPERNAYCAWWLTKEGLM